MMYQLKRENIQQRREVLLDCLNRVTASGLNAGSNLLVVDGEGEICYLENGYADLARKAPMQRNSIFRCYSMTKPVTSCAAMLLIQEGKLDLYEPVSRYISSFRHQRVLTATGEVPAARECLVRDLLDMTAGLAYDGDDTLPQRETKAVFAEAERRFDTAHPMDTQEFAELIGKIPLFYHPGEGWNYSVCADVLGAVIEKAADMPFADFVQQRILSPLGMEDSGFFVPEEKRARLVTVYQKDECGSLVPYTGNHLAIRNDGRGNAFHSGGAGLFSTIEDYARFARMLMNGGQNVLNENTVRFMTGRRQMGKPQQDIARSIGMEGRSYANLLRVTVDPAAAFFPTNMGEYGWDGWLSTFFINDPATGVTILLMQNQKDGDGTLIGKIRSLIYLS